MANKDLIERVVVNFRTHQYSFVLMPKMVPDALGEHLVRERIFRLKTRTPTVATDPISRSAKDALINERLHI